MQYGKSDQKMFLYATHDISLVNFLRAMGFLENYKLNLGASLIYELHTISKTQEVRVSDLRKFIKIVDMLYYDSLI